MAKLLLPPSPHIYRPPTAPLRSSFFLLTPPPSLRCFSSALAVAVSMPDSPEANEVYPTGEFVFREISGWKGFLVKLRLLFAFPLERVRKDTLLSIILCGQVISFLQKRLGQQDKTLRTVDSSFFVTKHNKYTRVRKWSLGLTRGKDTIAIIRASGSISRVCGQFGARSSGVIGEFGARSSDVIGEQFIEKIRSIRESKKHKAVIVRIDSPGSDALASDLMWREIKLLASTVPVVVSMSDVAASGGYYMAMAAGVIVAENLTLIGSIGVVTGKVRRIGREQGSCHVWSIWSERSSDSNRRRDEDFSLEEKVSSEAMGDEDDEFGSDDLSCFRGLVLDISYRPVNIVGWKRAICLEFMEKADVLEYYDQTVSSPSGSYYIPAVLRVPNLLQGVKRRRIKHNLSRKSIFFRDHHMCQYCSSCDHLTIDHVLPTSRGGEWMWENLVTACAKCNSKKGQKTLEEVNMKLIKTPKAPKEFDILSIPLASVAHNIFMMTEMPEEWRQYLGEPSST